MASAPRLDGDRRAQAGAGNGGTTGRDEQVWNVVLVHEKLVAMLLGNDAGIAGRDEDEGNALFRQQVGDGEAWFVPETDIQTHEIDGLGPQDPQRRRHRLRLGDDGGASITEHILDQFADQLGIFDQQDPDAIHLQVWTLTVPGDVLRMKQ